MWHLAGQIPLPAPSKPDPASGFYAANTPLPFSFLQRGEEDSFNKPKSSTSPTQSRAESLERMDRFGADISRRRAKLIVRDVISNTNWFDRSKRRNERIRVSRRVRTMDDRRRFAGATICGNNTREEKKEPNCNVPFERTDPPAKIINVTLAHHFVSCSIDSYILYKITKQPLNRLQYAKTLVRQSRFSSLHTCSRCFNLRFRLNGKLRNRSWEGLQSLLSKK